MKHFKKSRRSLWGQQPLTAAQTARLFARCHLLLGLPCVAAGALAALPFCSLIYSLSFRGGSYSLGIPVWKVIAWTALSALLLGLCSLAFLRRWIAAVPKTLSVYPVAALYVRQETARLHQKRQFCIPAVLLTAGIALTIVSIAMIPPSIRLAVDYRLEFVLELLTIGLGVFLLLHHAAKKRFAARIQIFSVPDTEQKDFFSRKREVRNRLIALGVYAGAVVIAYLILSLSFGDWVLYSFLPIAAFVLFLLYVLINHPFRRYASLRKWNVGKQLVNAAMLYVVVMICWSIVQTGYSFHNHFLDSLDYEVFRKSDFCEVTYEKETGVYTLTAHNDTFRILQLTDIHIGESITTIRTDRLALQTCYDLIAETQPDLIIVTGDIAYAIPAMTFSNNNLAAINTFAVFMNRVGIPWIFTYGNHDNEPASQYRDEKAFEGLFRYYQASRQSTMLYADRQPNIYGRYNQYLRICNADGSLNRLIFLVDSNDYGRNMLAIEGYDSVHDDQIQWYANTIDRVSAEEQRTVPSFVFMHIPFRAFADAQNALKDHSPDAVYLYGNNGEKVSHPNKDSGFFDAIVEKGSTQAVFVGHDHVNNMAIRYCGVDLVYSKSIDYVAYPGIASQTEQRGATLITVRSDGTYELEPISYAEAGTH